MKINKLLITIIAAAFIFMGCSNSLDSTPSATGRYSVTGKISFAGSSGAAPVIFTPATNGRNATTSFNNEHLSLNLYAYKFNEETQGPDTRKKYDNVVVDQSGSFIFCFEEKGSYIIYAEVLKDGTKCASGTTNIDITGFTTSTINIFTSPVITEDGKIQLAVSAATDTDPQIKKVCVSWIRSFGGRAEDDVGGNNESSDLEAAMERRYAVESGEYNMSFDLVNGTTEITYTDFPGGSWLAKISFDDDIGNTIYSCQEIINVYPTFTTNIWYGSSPALTDGTFKITTNMVTNYDAECYPNTNYVLFSKSSDNYQYYLKSSPAETVSGTSDFSSSLDSFCFDADGKFYILIQNGDGDIIKSNKYPDITLTDTYGSGIMVDLKTNLLYSYKGDQATLTLKRYPKLISEGSIEVEASDEINSAYVEAENVYYNNAKLTIFNSIVYILTKTNYGSGDYVLGIFDLSNNNHKTVNLSNEYSLSSVLSSSNVKFTDILYQDGAVYILLKESEEFVSRGALIKYDTTTDDIDVIGYSDAVKENSELADVMLQAYDREYDNDNNVLHYQLFTDAACSIPLYVPANTPFEDSETHQSCTIYGCFSSALYTPAPLADSLSEDAFYGPVKFIAIKPKKLVIADDGIAFYTDSEGVLKYKNVNRVVTVDLDTFSLEIQSAGVSFDSDATDKKTFFSTSADTGYSNALEAYISTTTPAYYDTGVQLTSRSNTYLAIPCGD